MEISWFTLRQLVKAARLALRMEKAVDALLFDSCDRTIANEVAGLLCDTLHDLSGEMLDSSQDFVLDSEVMKLLTGELSDGEVTDRLVQMQKENNRDDC